MAKKTTVKRVAVPVPKSPEETAKFIGKIGKHQRALQEIQTRLNEKIEKLKVLAVDESQSHQAEIKDLFEGVFVFAESHRDELTEGGKTKTVHLPTGDISWRITPPAVSLRRVKDIIAACKQLRLKRFIRTKEEIDKEAMLKEPDIATGIKGVSISQREEFVVKPSEVEVEISQKLQKKTGTK